MKHVFFAAYYDDDEEEGESRKKRMFAIKKFLLIYLMKSIWRKSFFLSVRLNYCIEYCLPSKMLK